MFLYNIYIFYIHYGVMELTDTLKKFTMMLSKKDTKEGMEHKENKECMGSSESTECDGKECMSCNSKKEF